MLTKAAFILAKYSNRTIVKYYNLMFFSILIYFKM